MQISFKKLYLYIIMNNLNTFLLLSFLISSSTFAQKGLGTNVPNPQSALEIRSPDKGVLLPRVTLTSSSTLFTGVTATASHTGMLVYNTNTATNTGLVGTGYYYWNGTYWEKFIGDSDLFTDLDGDTQIQVEESVDEDIIRFDTQGSERMVIDENGNVGIGVTSPHAPLQFANTSFNKIIVLNAIRDNYHQFYGFGTNPSTLRYQIANENAAHVFYAANSTTSSVELMRIRGNGRVGIGTPSPDQPLTVNGNASKVGGGNWATFSDLRVKENITAYKKGLEAILQISPVRFNYNEKSGYSGDNLTKEYVGVIAQDIEKVLPNTVTNYDDSEGPSGLSDKKQFDSSEILWTLINAVKELEAKNEQLRQRIEALEARREE